MHRAQRLKLAHHTAAAPACINCHNAHADSPRDDFEVGDTMGGIVIRIPLR